MEQCPQHISTALPDVWKQEFDFKAEDLLKFQQRIDQALENVIPCPVMAMANRVLESDGCCTTAYATAYVLVERLNVHIVVFIQEAGRFPALNAHALCMRLSAQCMLSQ